MKLPLLDGWNDQRRATAARYRAAIARRRAASSRPSSARAPTTSTTSSPCGRRAGHELLARLAGRGHRAAPSTTRGRCTEQPAYARWARGRLPEAERAAARGALAARPSVAHGRGSGEGRDDARGRQHDAGRAAVARPSQPVRVVYLNPFSQEVSGPDESLLALLDRAHPARRRGPPRAAGARSAGAALRGAGRRRSRRAPRAAPPRRLGRRRGPLSAAHPARGARGARPRPPPGRVAHPHEHGGPARRGAGGARRWGSRTSCTTAATRSTSRASSSTGSRRRGRRSPITSSASRARRRPSSSKRGRGAGRSRSSTTRSTSPSFAGAARVGGRARGAGRVAGARRSSGPWGACTRARTSRPSCARPRSSRRACPGRASSSSGSAEAPVELEYLRRVEALVARARPRGAVHVRGRAPRHPRRHEGARRLRADVAPRGLRPRRRRGHGGGAARRRRARGRAARARRGGSLRALRDAGRSGGLRRARSCASWREPEASAATAARAAERARGFDARAVAETVLGRYRALGRGR